MFGSLDQFFAPGRRHAEEERRRLALTREDAGDNDPARGPIDLTSGRVTISVPPPTKPEKPEEPASEEGDD